jgi:hypothetical protein
MVAGERMTSHPPSYGCRGKNDLTPFIYGCRRKNLLTPFSASPYAPGSARRGMASQFPPYGCNGKNDLTISTLWLQGEGRPHTLHPWLPAVRRGGISILWLHSVVAGEEMTSTPPSYGCRGRNDLTPPPSYGCRGGMTSHPPPNGCRGGMTSHPPPNGCRGGMTSHLPPNGSKGRNDLTTSILWLQGEE